VSATPLENASLQEASYLKERRVNIVVRLLAESLVVVLVVVFGWWGMWGLGSYTLLSQTQPEPIYVAAGCPVADQLQKSSTWRARAARIPRGSRSHIFVEPSISVNRKVTVLAGGMAISCATSLLCRGLRPYLGLDPCFF
jgi:hypothetical protein